MKSKLLKNRLLAILLMLTMSTMMLLTACGSEDADTDEGSGQETTETDTDGTADSDGAASFGDITIAYPDGWSIESNTEDRIQFSKVANKVPFFYVENDGWVGSPDTFIDNEMDAFTTKYQERVEMQPEVVDYADYGKELKGFTARYSSEDGTASITRYEFVEVIDDVTYLYVCEYISGGYGDVHEDETTYFEFMDAIGSIKAK